MAMTAVVSEKARPFVLSAVSCRVLCASRSAPWSAPRPTSVRAEELLGLVRERVNVGDQLIGVIRKGTRALQWVPASPDAFVWLRRYQLQMHGLVPGMRSHFERKPVNPRRERLARRGFRPVSRAAPASLAAAVPAPGTAPA
jgi:hypothetical protein